MQCILLFTIKHEIYHIDGSDYQMFKFMPFTFITKNSFLCILYEYPSEVLLLFIITHHNSHSARKNECFY